MKRSCEGSSKDFTCAKRPSSHSKAPENALAFLMKSNEEKAKALAEGAPPVIQTPSQILDRFSKFVSHHAKVTSKRQVQAVQAILKTRQVFKSATHNIQAWRFLKLPPNADGSDPSHFQLEEGWDEDGEKDAGRKLLAVLRQVGACDVMVIVTRWYGGTNLGPVRFDHINNMGIAALEFGGFIRALNNPEAMHISISSTDTLAAPDDGSWTSNSDKEALSRQLRAKMKTIESFGKLERDLRTKAAENANVIQRMASQTSWKGHVADLCDSGVQETTSLEASNENLEAVIEKGYHYAKRVLDDKGKYLGVLKSQVSDLKRLVSRQAKLIEDMTFTLAAKANSGV